MTEYCAECHLTFGSAEQRYTVGAFVYHMSCYGKMLMKKFKSIGGIYIH